MRRRPEALWHATLAPARILGLEETVGRLEPGRPASFIEVQPAGPLPADSADDAIRALLPRDLDNPKPIISRVTLAGTVVFQRSGQHA